MIRGGGIGCLKGNIAITRRGVMLALASLAALPGIALAQGGNLGFLKHDPLASLTDADRKLQRQAVNAVLSSTDPGATRTWQNADTGSSGNVKVLSDFNTKDQRECKRLRFEMHTKKAGDSVYTMNACRAAAGRWLFDPEARPAGSR